MGQRNIITIVKGPHKFVLVWDAGRATIEDLEKQVRKWAEDPELQFTWFDAAALCGRVRAAMG